MNLQDALSSGIQALGLDLPADTPERLDAFARLLIKWNKVYNLTAIRHEEQVLTHHLLDSLSVLPALAAIFLGALAISALPWLAAQGEILLHANPEAHVKLITALQNFDFDAAEAALQAFETPPA